ncbi:hypothetical protein [Nocardia huaxiensis]|uniref:DoxX-like protein n=1 Tax=Nocardia huaxiensis TaxID=2755382 RepID=A0A7D6ZL41_9NOCA|nr:hypothetical protein [Nocardia huaxiensis]QLY33247.1 hypothetical protein H0264_14330 [Nocardia huaxiensis]UFS99820.1 hypothetical protein LPY97_19045 [Nocardia huaxiensis]
MGERKRKRQASQALVAGKTPKNPVVINARTPDSVPARLFGLGLAGTGAAHFTAPGAFEPVTKLAFPQDTRRWTYSNGMTELLLGLAIAFRRTRVIGVVGFLAYVAFLGSRFTGNLGGDKG